MIKDKNDIKQLINKHQNEYKYGTMENLLDEYYKKIKENEIKWIHKETLCTDEHRWFTTETNVYEFFKGDKSLGFLAIDEVGMLKSESMCYEDCFVEIVAYDVKEVIKKSFEIIK